MLPDKLELAMSIHEAILKIRPTVAEFEACIGAKHHLKEHRPTYRGGPHEQRQYGTPCINAPNVCQLIHERHSITDDFIMLQPENRYKNTVALHCERK